MQSSALTQDQARTNDSQPRSEPGGWEARLRLGFERRAGRTALVEREHRGPLMVQKPFLSDDGRHCQVVVLHPPGGIVGGDRLEIEASVDDGCEVLLTTTAATKFYGSPELRAQQRQRLRVRPGGTLEWLPQETILFDAARADLITRVELEGDARFVGWEITALGRPASKLPYVDGHCDQRFELYRDGRPLWIDRGRFIGGSDKLSRNWGLGGFSVMGTMVWAGVGDAEIDLCRTMLTDVSFDGRVGVTRRDDVMVCRALGRASRKVLELFAGTWSGMRAEVFGSAATPPRIWAT